MQKNFMLNCLVEFFKLDFFLKGLKGYAHFGGRDSRKEFFLFQFSVVLIFIGLRAFAERFDGFIYLIFYILFMFPPVISSMIRRLHDVGKRGLVLPASVLIGSLFFVCGVLFFNVSDFVMGTIAILSFLMMLYPVFLFFMPSKEGVNKYDNQSSHPIRHGMMLVCFISIFMFFIYLFGLFLSQVEVLQQEETLTTEEIKEIDDLIKKYQDLK